MDRLSRPAGALCHSLTPLPPETSLRRAAEIMVEEGLPALPVADPGFLYGVISQRGLLRASAAGAELSEAIIDWTDAEAPRIYTHNTAADAFRRMEEAEQDWLLVLDSSDQAAGILTAAQLASGERVAARPQVVGGMATPLGVYLTNGLVGAGVSPWALVLTGVTLFSFFAVGAILMNVLFQFLPESFALSPWGAMVYEAGTVLVFLAGLRFAPLAGIHAAEHKVVHAIERGEELIPSVVKRMPRVHPRCGTNLAVGAMVFLGIMSWEAIGEVELRLLAALLVTVIVWRPLGTLMQYYVTTREPNEKQIAMGIRSGKALLEKAVYAPQARATIFRRILASGIIFIMLGALGLQAVLYLVSLMLPEQWRGILLF